VKKKFKGSRGHLGKISFVEGNLTLFKICEKKIQGLPQILGKKIKGSRGTQAKSVLGRENLSECLKFWGKKSRAPAGT